MQSSKNNWVGGGGGGDRADLYVSGKCVTYILPTLSGEIHSILAGARTPILTRLDPEGGNHPPPPPLYYFDIIYRNQKDDSSSGPSSGSFC